MNLLIATGNRHKFQEISAILKSDLLIFMGLKDLVSPPAVIEDGLTFEANAIKKAVELARFSGLWTLADDSGLEVDALNGEPGVYSARYAGEPSDDTANNRKLLANLAGCVNRRARFRCAIALADPAGVARTVSGACEGTLLEAVRGEGGFGYDPLFVPLDSTLTFAELPATVKNTQSHRAQALREAVHQWGGVLAREGDELVGAVIDARRREVFAAVYAEGPDGALTEVVAPAAWAPDDFATAASAAGAAVLVGDGAPLVPPTQGLRVAQGDVPHRISALSLVQRVRATGPLPVQPAYLRLPDAEENRLRRIAEAASA